MERTIRKPLPPYSPDVMSYGKTSHAKYSIPPMNSENPRQVQVNSQQTDVASHPSYVVPHWPWYTSNAVNKNDTEGWHLRTMGNADRQDFVQLSRSMNSVSSGKFDPKNAQSGVDMYKQVRSNNTQSSEVDLLSSYQIPPWQSNPKDQHFQSSHIERQIPIPRRSTTELMSNTTFANFNEQAHRKPNFRPRVFCVNYSGYPAGIKCL